MAEDFTARFKVDVSDLKSGLTSARKEIKQANAEFKASTAGMDSWKKDAEGLSAKLKQLNTVLKQQKAILQNYQAQLKQQQTAYDENGKRADQLRQKLADLAAQGVDKASAEYKKYESALKRVESEQERNEKSIQTLNEKIRAQDTAITATSNETQKWTRHLDELQSEEEETARSTQQLDSANEKLNNGFTVMKGVVSNLVTSGLRKLGEEMKSVVTDGAAYADTIATLSSTTSVSTDTLQKLDYMSGLVDVDVNTVAKSMQRLTKSMSSAQDGSGAAADAFKDLGVTVTDANGNLRDNEEVFFDVIAALGKIENETQRDATAMKLFGKSATDLNPMIEAGADQLNAWAKEAEDAGLIMSEDMIKGLVRVQDEFDRFDATVKGVKNSIAAGLAPALEKGSKKLNEMIRSNNWEKVGKDLGNLFSGLIDGFEWIVEHGDGIKAILTGIIAAFAAQKIMAAVESIGKMTKALLTMNAAANANPYMLLVTAIVAVGAATTSALLSAQEAYKENNKFVQGVDELTTELDTHIETINEMAAAYDDAKKSREDQMNAGLAEIGHVESLTAQLSELVDENGNVTQANKDRAQFILGELNTALGTEYKMTGLNIDNYREMTGAIAEMIEQKKAEIVLQAQEDAYRQAVVGRADAERELETAIQNRAATEEYMAEIQQQIKDKQDLVKDSLLGTSQGAYALGNDLAILNEAYAQAEAKLGEYDEAIQTSADVVDQYAYDITQYEAAATAAITGDYEKIAYKSWETAKAQGAASTQASQTVITKAQEGTTEWLKNLSQMVADTTGKNVEFRDAGKGMVQMWVDGQKEGEELPASQVKVMAQKMIWEAHVLANKMGESGKNAVLGLTQGVSLNEFLATQSGASLAATFLAGFRKKMDEGSPSKEMMRSAVNAILGFTNEIERDKGKAETAGDVLANSFLSGFQDGMSDAFAGVDGAAQAMRVGGQYGGFANSPKIVNNNLVQNNYSPKALSRIEVYRDMRNLLQLMGGNS